MNFSSIYMTFILCISFIFRCIFINFLLWKISLIFCLCQYLLCQRRITTLMSISDGPHPYFFCQKMEKMRSMKEKMDGNLFISRQSWHFPCIDDMIKVLFPICTLIWRVNNYDSRQGKDINKRNESTLIIIKIFSLLVLYLL